MKKQNPLLYILFIALLFISCEKEEEEDSNAKEETGKLTDIDGNTYKFVTINNQAWMAKNLATTKYNDGTPIPNVTGDSEWANLSTPAYCWYENNDSTYKNKYGALYNWYTVETGKLCPDGWHVPSDDEWNELKRYIVDSHPDVGWEGPNVGEKLKAKRGWKKGGSGTDKYDFKALPGGYHGSLDGGFNNVGYGGNWWTSDEHDSNHAWYWFLNYVSIKVHRNHFDKGYGYSVRCIRD